MSYYIIGILMILGLMVCMLIMLEVGRRIGQKRKAALGDATAGLGVVDGAVFGLVGLLIAFSFSGAASRFDGRRQLIVEEGNAIGTAYLRIDLLPAAAQPELRQNFRDYVDARLSVYRALPDMDKARAQLTVSAALQNRIWSQAVAACKAAEVNGNAVTSLVLSSLNEMIDITAVRTMAAQAHPPALIFVMLAVLVLAGALLAGFGMAEGAARSWLHIAGFAVLMTVSVYVIIDLEFPRFGLIRVDAWDQVLVEVRQSMK